ncbi:hypothetical protein D3C86_760480 [compost metagenome]
MKLKRQVIGIGLLCIFRRSCNRRYFDLFFGKNQNFKGIDMEVETSKGIALRTLIQAQANTPKELHEASFFEIRQNGSTQPVIAIEIGDDLFAL